MVRQDKNITDDVWQKRRDHLSAEHRHPDARRQLEMALKEWIEHESFKERREAAAWSRPSTVIPVYGESFGQIKARVWTQRRWLTNEMIAIGICKQPKKETTIQNSAKFRQNLDEFRQNLGEIRQNLDELEF